MKDRDGIILYLKFSVVLYTALHPSGGWYERMLSTKIPEYNMAPNKAIKFMVPGSSREAVLDNLRH